MVMEVIDFELVVAVFVIGSGLFGFLTLVVWGVILLIFMNEIDDCFDSPDFPNRGYKGVWPWGMGRAMAYGVFYVFPNSWFVRKKFPNARESIKIDEIPGKIKFMAAFPMYTCIPSALIMFSAGAVLKLNEWSF
ncbi:hypothetical protein FZZ93_16010 [Halomonas eurihalina]|uniref:Uncharacterized protein n=1 Tax=Halomonas eurihalina TaxID=42566 RepID=A0A5D9CLA4_HALER|nr:hypothetical protein [Halomonas eurihalina]MDR5860471.1 hypothetical protein [Halomonas eurihalina]TZG32818.1 hypothetical protein FZZ93_16010 [Halomonas eurihalina]